MENLLEKLQPKWFVVLLGIFIVGRAITALVFPEFGKEILSDGGQVVLWGFTLSYIGNTVVLPLIFALVTVELSKNSLSRLVFLAVIGIHILAVLGASVSTGFDAVSFGSSAMQGGQEGYSITNETIFYRSLLALVLTSITCTLAIIWQKKNYRIFSRAETTVPRA